MTQKSKNLGKLENYLNRIIEIFDVDDTKFILNNQHNTLLGGHAAYERMLNSVRTHHKWNNMQSDIKKIRENWAICQKNKISRHNHQSLVITSIPIACSETIDS